METQQFGEHVTIDGYRGSFDKLNNDEVVYNCLNDLPEALGMTKMIPEPIMERVGPNDMKDPGGITGFMLIKESHISIHTFPGRGFVSADVYTCKPGMDVEKIVAWFRDTFELDDVEYKVIERGTKYPVEDLYDQEGNPLS